MGGGLGWVEGGGGEVGWGVGGRGGGESSLPEEALSLSQSRVTRPYPAGAEHEVDSTPHPIAMNDKISLDPLAWADNVRRRISCGWRGAAASGDLITRFGTYRVFLLHHGG